ncbi:MAG: carboxypeptidase-like regulatory domain-containing protein, partial [Tannerella sp.]|nr:carboxypeptidase-like regulatory domain-containing protein [Tannerella sp.]
MEYKNSNNKFLGKDKKKYVILCLILFAWVFRPDMLYAQQSTVTLSVTNVNLQSVFDRIEKETNYRFTYKDVVLPVEKNISISEKDKPVEAFLNQLLASTNLSFKRNGNTFAIIQKPVPKDITVSGAVVDETGEPLPGVNISIKGTTTGVVSDVDGKYNMTIPDANVVLAFSFIGYATQEIAVGNRTVIDITLNEDTRQLDEVVVVGYGTMQRKNFTGSVSTVNVANSPVALSSRTNAMDALRGTVTGTVVSRESTAGSTPSIQVHGQKSVNGSSTPLVVLDGVIFMGNWRDIDPATIENISILKDATSLAAYGSQAANGVVMITTKKGTLGKPVISFEGSLSSSGKA